MICKALLKRLVLDAARGVKTSVAARRFIERTCACVVCAARRFWRKP